MTDINIEIRIRNADAYKNIARVAEGIREELRELLEYEAVPPVEITVTIHDGKGHASSRDVYKGAME
ncbi:MAG: hypothetical protein IKE76_04110 [Clostridia bacterium]|nr:hypothetical protein [Clostridia bacterium]